jgi:hypothetical protein
MLLVSFLFLQRLYIIHQTKFTSCSNLGYSSMNPEVERKEQRRVGNEFPYRNSESFAVMKRFTVKFAVLAPNLGTETCWPNNPVGPC